MELKNRKQQIESLLQAKLQQLQRLEQTRTQLSTEIIELRGKLSLLEELEKDEEQPKDKNSEAPGK